MCVNLSSFMSGGISTGQTTKRLPASHSVSKSKERCRMANQIDAAAANLLEIKKQISEDPKGKPPAVLCVLCGMANAAYQRPDGVFVIPVTALKN